MGSDKAKLETISIKQPLSKTHVPFGTCQQFAHGCPLGRLGICPAPADAGLVKSTKFGKPDQQVENPAPDVLCIDGTWCTDVTLDQSHFGAIQRQVGIDTKPVAFPVEHLLFDATRVAVGLAAP